MENSSEHHDFIHNWIKQKIEQNNFDPEIINAIESSLMGVRDEQLDEFKLLNLLIAIANEGDRHV